MKLTVRSQNALKALIDMGERGVGSPVRCLDMANRQDVTLGFLEQIFKDLRKDGIVKGVKGPRGGYTITRPLDQITIKQVLDSVGEPYKLHTKDKNIDTTAKKALNDFMKHTSALLEKQFTMTVGGLLSRSKGNL